MSPHTNIAYYLTIAAQERPDAPAIYVPAGRPSGNRIDYREHSYAELDRLSTEIAIGLGEYGVTPGTRVALMVRPSFELFALTFGLFKAGAVPVLIDPGIGLKRMGRCIAEAAPSVFIGIPAAHIARLLFGWGRATIQRCITVGSFRLWGGISLDRLAALGRASSRRLPQTVADDEAAILFTSGSTGAPKGVVYLHRHFLAQVQLIRESYDIRPGEVDLPTFPLFALFDPALQMTTVIPYMDPTRPAKANPRLLHFALETFEVTNMFGSPALLNTLGRYLEAHEISLPHLRRVISAGAVVPAHVLERISGAMPDTALIHTPYGATECLPVATAEHTMLLGPNQVKTRAGAGVCVGRVVAPNEVSIIGITDDVIEEWNEDLVLPRGERGEIVVRGPTTTQSYFARPTATAASKITHGDDPWCSHRMGDVGYLDEAGLLWFCGRKTHRVQTRTGTLFTVPIEAVFNEHPMVFRTALVGIGTPPTPVLCVELEPNTSSGEWPRIESELKVLGQTNEESQQVVHFLRHDGFPVDIRHNAKIERAALALWAERHIQ